MPETPEPLRATHSLVARALATLLACVGLVVLLAAAWWLPAEERRQERDFATRQALLVAGVQRSLAGPLWQLDGSAVRQQMRGVLADPTVESLQLDTDALNGSPWREQRAQPSGGTLRSHSFDIAYAGPGSQEPTRVGRATLVLNTQALAQAQREAQRLIAWLGAALVLSLALCAALGLHWSVRRPLRQLGAWSQQRSRGAVVTPLPLQRRDEIGQLARQLHAMDVQLQQAAQATARSELRYRTLFESAGEGLFLVSARGRLLEINGALAAMLGVGSAQEALRLSRRAHRLVHLSRVDQRIMAQRLRREGGLREHSLVVTTLSGRELWLQLSLHRIQPVSDEPPLFQGLVQDVTQARQAEATLSLHRHQLESMVQARTAQLREAVTQAHEEGEAKGRFLASLTRACRRPLDGWLRRASSLRSAPSLPEPLRDDAHALVQAGEGMRSLMDEALDLAALDAGKLRLQLAPVQPASLIEWCVSQSQARCQAQGVTLLLELDPALPERVLADGHRLRQVLQNLIDQALRRSPAGGCVALGAQSLPEADAGRCRLRFELSDGGAPMSQQQLEALQVPLHAALEQLDAAGAQDSHLGLAISQALLPLMQSALHIQSRPQAGVRYHFELDLARYQPLHALP